MLGTKYRWQTICKALFCPIRDKIIFRCFFPTNIKALKSLMQIKELKEWIQFIRTFIVSKNLLRWMVTYSTWKVILSLLLVVPEFNLKADRILIAFANFPVYFNKLISTYDGTISRIRFMVLPENSLLKPIQFTYINGTNVCPLRNQIIQILIKRFI